MSCHTKRLSISSSPGIESKEEEQITPTQTDEVKSIIRVETQKLKELAEELERLINELE